MFYNPYVIMLTKFRSVLTKPGSKLTRIALFAVVIAIIAIIGSIIYSLVSSLMQRREFADAKSRCGRDPYVIVDSENVFFGGGRTYYFYTPESPYYSSNKTTVPSLVNYTSVYGYYCTIDEARMSPVGEQLSEYESNYSSETQRELIESYFAKLRSEGINIHEPTDTFTGFEIINRKINIFEETYTIEMKNTQQLQTSNESGILIHCKKTDTEAVRQDDDTVIGINSEGKNVYSNGDKTYTYSYITDLSDFSCEFEFNNQISTIDAYNLIISARPIGIDTIRSYTFSLH